MKKLIYNTAGISELYNPETEEVEQQQILVGVVVENPTAADIERAEAVAFNGEYTIEDDGQPVPETTDDVLNALLGVTV